MGDSYPIDPLYPNVGFAAMTPVDGFELHPLVAPLWREGHGEASAERGDDG